MTSIAVLFAVYRLNVGRSVTRLLRLRRHNVAAATSLQPPIPGPPHCATNEPTSLHRQRRQPRTSNLRWLRQTRDFYAARRGGQVYLADKTGNCVRMARSGIVDPVEGATGAPHLLATSGRAAGYPPPFCFSWAHSITDASAL